MTGLMELAAMVGGEIGGASVSGGCSTGAPRVDYGTVAMVKADGATLDVGGGTVTARYLAGSLDQSSVGKRAAMVTQGRTSLVLGVVAGT